MKELSIFEIISGNTFEQLKSILTGPDYKLKIDETEDHYLIKYSMIDSDLSKLAVKQSRGIIFRKSDNKLVCYPFDKFFNYGEGEADVIDWNTARVQEKLDGSIIKVWWDDKWHISTNGKVDAFDAKLSSNLIFDNFGELFMSTVGSLEVFNDYKGYTLMFELMSPHNRVIVPHKDVRVVHIGTRNNETHKEVELDIGFEKPKYFNLKTMDDVIKVVKEFPYDEEGCVVVDANWKRNKVKSPAYLAVHNIKGDGVIRENNMLHLIRTNDYQEFLSYFPEYHDVFFNMKEKYEEYLFRLSYIKEKGLLKIKSVEDKKEFALWAKGSLESHFLFKLYGDDDYAIEDYLNTINDKKLLYFIKMSTETKMKWDLNVNNFKEYVDSKYISNSSYYDLITDIQNIGELGESGRKYGEFNLHFVGNLKKILAKIDVLDISMNKYLSSNWKEGISINFNRM